MTMNTFFDKVWTSLFFAILAAISLILLPEHPVFHFAFLPMWLAYRLLAHKAPAPLWEILWVGLLCETMWDIPPFGGISAMLLLWKALRALRENFPKTIRFQHGVAVGLVATPILWLWVCFYTLLWLGKDALPLTPSFGDVVAAPVIGAIGGGIAFGLYRKWDFLCLRPLHEVQDEG